MNNAKYPLNERYKQSPNSISQFVSALLIVTILALSDSFWALIAALFNSNVDYSLAAQIIKALLLSIGLILFVSRWERGVKIVSSFWVLIFALLLAYVSAIWSLSPFDTIRGSLMLLLLLFFGAAMAILLDNRSVARAASIGAIIITSLDFGAHFFTEEAGVDTVSFSALGLLLVANLWAFSISKKARHIWLLIALIAIGLSLYYEPSEIFGSALGIFFAFAINAISKMRLGRAQNYAAILALVIVLATIVLVFRGAAISNSLSELFYQLGPNASFGSGFETVGASIAAQFGRGLGAIGICIGLITIFAGFAAAYLNGKVTFGTSLALFGIGGQLVFSPQSTNLIGPEVLVFVIALYRTRVGRMTIV